MYQCARRVIGRDHYCISYLMMFFCLYDNSFMYVVFLLLNGKNASRWGMLIRISFSNIFCCFKKMFCLIWFLVNNVWHYKMDVGELVGVLSCTMPSQWGPLRTIQAACGELVRWRESMTERQRQSDNSRGAGPVVLATSVFWATAVWVSPWPSPRASARCRDDRALWQTNERQKAFRAQKRD